MQNNVLIIAYRNQSIEITDMQSLNTFTSKIATIVYKNYTENVDMNNELFKQSELNVLIKTDKDIVRVDYYINGVLVGSKMYTGKQALSQIIKIEKSISKIDDKMEIERGSDWYARIQRNKTRNAKIQELESKIQGYTKFVTEEDFNNCEYDFCMSYEDFIG